MTIRKGHLGCSALSAEVALALSNAFAAIRPVLRKPKRAVVQVGKGWSDPTFGTMPRVHAER